MINIAPLHLLAAVVGIIIIILWLRVIFQAILFEKKEKEFSDLVATTDEPFLVSIVVPARNEELNLQACLNSLKKLNYKNIEVLLINDRSEDGTGRVMKENAALLPRGQYIEIKNLPDGWLGKNHALYVGAQAAKGEYVLFTDGDILFDPQTLNIAVRAVTQKNLDHLAITPQLKSKGALLAAMQCYFGITFLSMVQAGRIGEDPRFYIGSGAFNMVRRSKYFSFNGHHKLRLEVIDDVMLGKVMVQAGGKLGFINGKDLISVDWYPDWISMIKGLEKNGFSAFRFSVWKFLAMTLGTLLIQLWPYIAIFVVPPPVLWIYVAVLAISHTLYAVGAFKMKYSPLVTLLVPFAAWLVYFAFLRSTVLALSRGHVKWRGTKYSLKELKENVM